ncbi:proline dioxygenase [Paraburkholderia phytofirmans OLGA172]|uniref:Proline dioxygenase n=1 Tax=Paraburkholderia phytofirmans OLGA172 TaxID=1417228 RepID=A0A160FVP6_9BURK|nr:2OG-Fe(II) oxygenase [Paraburkholderia phytofirmans]ANB77425.1 proline dioxygenase [Paraburkholderia phytofirmans OLGA172]
MLDINAAVEEWLTDHASRGCNRQSMFDAMLKVGFEPERAAGVIDATFKGIQSKDPLPMGIEALRQGEYLYDACPVAADNVIRTFDRDVTVSMRCERPQIIAFDNVLSAEECAEVIERSRPRLKRSVTGVGVYNSIRTSDTAGFLPGEDAFIQRLEQRFASLMNWPVENGEPLQVQRYKVTGEYKPHHDYYSPQQPGAIVRGKDGGQRVATLIVYLNDVPQGGATQFPLLGLSITAKQGGALYFRYMNGQRQLDALTLHAGAPVLAGEKWIVTKWVTERPLESRARR